jgi:hypothetical protein
MSETLRLTRPLFILSLTIPGSAKFSLPLRNGRKIMWMDEKDLVAARSNLDTFKILPAFKVVDEGARQDAESFRGLNATVSEKR